METLDAPEFAERKPKRTFLIILSVLSFINAGVRIFFAIVVFIIMNAFPVNYNQQSSEEDKWMALFGFALLASALITIFSVILMLLRRRSAIWGYIFGQAVFLVVSCTVYILMTRYDQRLNARELIVVGCFFTLPLVNILLYSLALRNKVR